MNNQYPVIAALIVIAIDVAAVWFAVAAAKNVYFVGFLVAVLAPFLLLVIIPFIFFGEPTQASAIVKFPASIRVIAAGVMALINSVVLYAIKIARGF